MPQKHLIIPTLFSLLILSILLASIHVYTDKRADEIAHEKYQNKANEIDNLVSTLIQSQKDKMTFIALSLAQDSQLKEALLNPNVQLSYRDYLKTLSQHSDLKHLWLHIVDKTGHSIYRSWTNKRGDIVLDKRRDLQKMLQKPRVIETISVGLFDMTFKSSVPIYDKDRFLGVFEVIGKFNSIVEKLKNRHIESVLLVDKRYRQQIKFPFSKRFLDGYYLVNGQASETNLQQVTRHALLAYSKNHHYYVDTAQQQLITFYKLPNINGEPMGHFFFFYPLNRIEAGVQEIKPFNLYTYTILVYLFLLVGYFYWANKNHTREIFNFNRQLAEKVDQKTQQLSIQKQFLQNVIDGVSDAVTVYDSTLSTSLMNRAANTLPELKFSQNQLNSSEATLETYPAALKLASQSFESGQPHKAVLYYLDNQFKKHYVELTTTPIKNSQNEITSIIQLGHEITNYLDIQEQLQQQKNDLDFIAYHDPLTDLPNRILFLDRLNQAINQAQRNNEKIALLFIDLDRFKEINDSFGHNSGDEVLIVCAERLQNCIRKIDTVARLGGDEFTILLDALKSNNVIINIVEKIINRLSAPIYLGDDVFHVTASIGISLFPTDGQDAQQLLKNADAAMYKAKDDGKNTYHFYTKEMTEQAFERIFMENNLREALSRNEFEMYYQPQYDSSTNEIVGFEALVRWNHPERGLISPEQFIPVAEETGLIVPLGRQILDMATATIAEWQRNGLTRARMAINVSAKQLRDISFTQTLSAILDKNQCLPEWVELEITESSVMKNTEHTIKLLHQIRRRGITISIDDFGTGYSSLAYLKKLPINKVKIDRSFICNLPGDKDDAEITKAIISMSRSLNLDIIAEGIETDEQRAFVNSEGCYMIQGYLYSKPVTYNEMTAKLQSNV
ncbi:MAG: EAL domain-containing protein [Hydrogenovibrio sp.]